MELILKNNTYYEVEQSDLIYWAKAYPNIDVYAEMMKMQAWCLSNPAKRKTKQGAKSFINAWLNRGNDRGKTIEIPTSDKLCDVSWINYIELREASKQHFINKYGFYYFNGQRIDNDQSTSRPADNQLLPIPQQEPLAIE